MVAPETLDTLLDVLHSAAVADVLDGLGYRSQAMSHEIRPLVAGARLIGRAATAQVIEVDELPESPYELTIELIDSLVEGEVVVASANRSRRSALWGELLTTGAMARGARGVVTDGLCRDTRRIDEMGFPVFAAGVSPLDSMGRLEVVALRVPVVVGGVSVAHSDLVLADHDGVVVIPASVEETVVRRALEKVENETEVRSRLRAGATLRATFDELKLL